MDFAYAVHTEVGNKCIGVAGQRPARRAGAPARERRGRRDLHLEGRGGRARRATGWASSSSPRAKQKIKQWFAKERREEAIEGGKDAITREARRTGLPLQRLVSADSMGALARELRYADVSALYAAVGEHHV